MTIDANRLIRGFAKIASYFRTPMVTVGWGRAHFEEGLGFDRRFSGGNLGAVPGPAPDDLWAVSVPTNRVDELLKVAGYECDQMIR